MTLVEPYPVTLYIRLLLYARVMLSSEFDGTSGVRCHLGLRVPPSGAMLRVQDQAGESTVKSWVAGEWVCFNGSAIHEAWNGSDEPRTVFLLDFFTGPTDLVRTRSLIPDWLNHQIEAQTSHYDSVQHEADPLLPRQNLPNSTQLQQYGSGSV